MKLNAAGCRRALMQDYDAAQLDAFVLDHFPQVYDRFGSGMTKDHKITLLLDACRRSEQEAARLQSLLGVEAQPESDASQPDQPDLDTPARRLTWLKWGAIGGALLATVFLIGWIFNGWRSGSQAAVQTAAAQTAAAALPATATEKSATVTAAVEATRTPQPTTPRPTTPQPSATHTASPSATSQPPATPTSALPPPDPQEGDTWLRPADGMRMTFIEAGEFSLGAGQTEQGADSDEKPHHAVFLDAFWIDTSEVTNAMFRAFVQATAYQTQAEKSGSGYVYQAPKWVTMPGADWQHPQGPQSSLAGLDNHPVVQVAWSDALAYCRWAGGGLPTEAQWEKAARGGLLEVSYPWGASAPVCARQTPNGANFSGCAGRTQPVGSYWVNEYGLYDMAGNVWEWVLDWYDSHYYSSSIYDNPQGPGTGSERTARGGSWISEASDLRAANRNKISPTYSLEDLGFRCTRIASP